MTDLLTTDQVAELIGVQRPTINVYLSRHTFPPPDVWTRDGMLWEREVVTEWMKDRRSPGQRADYQENRRQGLANARRTRYSDASDDKEPSPEFLAEFANWKERNK